jgi:hypothetical protein
MSLIAQENIACNINFHGATDHPTHVIKKMLLQSLRFSHTVTASSAAAGNLVADLLSLPPIPSDRCLAKVTRTELRLLSDWQIQDGCHTFTFTRLRLL